MVGFIVIVKLNVLVNVMIIFISGQLSKSDVAATNPGEKSSFFVYMIVVVVGLGAVLVYYLLNK